MPVTHYAAATCEASHQKDHAVMEERLQGMNLSLQLAVLQLLGLEYVGPLKELSHRISYYLIRLYGSTCTMIEAKVNRLYEVRGYLM